MKLDRIHFHSILFELMHKTEILLIRFINNLFLFLISSIRTCYILVNQIG